MPTSINTILDRLAQHPLVTVHRGATQQDLRSVYGTLKVKLPSSYLAFVNRFGWADLNGDTLYGLGPDAEEAQSVLEVSCSEHTMLHPPMLSRLVPLMNDGAGNHDCLDTSKMKNGECPVVFWDHEHPAEELQRPRRVAANFTNWLKRKLDELPDGAGLAAEGKSTKSRRAKPSKRS